VHAHFWSQSARRRCGLSPTVVLPEPFKALNDFHVEVTEPDSALQSLDRLVWTLKDLPFER
jgi:hypothetical protein